MPGRMVVVCVGYNDRPQVEGFIREILSLAVAPDWELSIALCDNSADWDDELGSRDIVISRPGKNLGYINGAASALDRWRCEKGGMPEAAIITNTDVVLDRDFFVNLPPLLSRTDVGAIAPHVVTRSGRNLNPHHARRPSRWKLLLNLTLTGFDAGYRIRQLAHKAKQNLGELARGSRLPTSELQPRKRQPLMEGDETTIYAPHGSCFVVTKHFFEMGGALEWPGFLYGEEIHIAEQVARIGLRTIMTSRLKAIHAAPGMPNRLAAAGRRALAHESLKLLWRTYFK